MDKKKRRIRTAILRYFMEIPFVEEIENDSYPADKQGQFADDTLPSQNFYNPCPAELYLSMNLRQIQQYFSEMTARTFCLYSFRCKLSDPQTSY
jgi:hypothetical protein